jgi:DNA-directed RNA polymerase specialized sigma24 family protein
MRFSDPNNPAPPVKKLITTSGVEVIVNPPPPPAPERRREPAPQGPQAIILPEGQSEEERRAWLDALCRQYGPVIDKILADRNDTLEESRKDLRQRVLLIFCEKVVAKRKIEKAEAYLHGIVRREVSNHKAVVRPPVAHGVDPTEVVAFAEEEPHEEAELNDLLDNAERFLDRVPPEEAEVFRCVVSYGLTLEQTAGVVGRAVSTVFDELKTCRAKLRKMMRDESEAATSGAKKNDKK